MSKIMIPSEYIKTFLPIHELDELEAAGRTVPLQPDDLFLISQMSAYSTRESNAVAVSKKLNYKNLSQKISDDFGIADIKLSVAGKLKPIEDLSAKLSSISKELSNAIRLSSYALSSYTNEICIALSTTVSGEYIQKYENQTCCFTQKPENFTNDALFATNVTFSNGQIANIERAPLSDLIAPEKWRIANGAIAAQTFASYVHNVTNPVSEVTQEILSDCYVNCMISANEDDHYGPIQVWLSSNLGVDGINTKLYRTLNNPGGFSGKPYFNNYNFSIPLKNINGSKIIVKYADSSLQFKNGSRITFDCYYYYAVPAKDDLNEYVKKPIPAPQPYDIEHVCKLKFNTDGVITNAESVYYGDATFDEAGLVKVNKSFMIPRYGLSTQNGYGYVEIPHATSADYGTIKYNYSAIAQQHYHNFANILYTVGSSKNFLWCGLEKDDSDKAVTFIPCASDTTFGVVRLKPNEISSNASTNDSLSSYLGVDADGYAYVTIPYAHYDENNNPVPGIIRTGWPDTTGMRVIRNVYLDSKGRACVNVANQIGVGSFPGGYTKNIVVDLQNPVNVSEFTDQISSFDGISADCSEYGSWVFAQRNRVNGWFMAELMYEGTGRTSYSANDGIQIICDSILVTTINPLYMQTCPGKKFMYSIQLGVFLGDQESGSNRLFAAISNKQNFDNDKLHFLIKEVTPE